MRSVVVETESRPVEDAAFGDGGMERAANRGLLAGGFLGVGKLRSVPPPNAGISPSTLIVSPAQAAQLSHVYMTINGQTFQSEPPVVAAEPGTCERVLEQKFLSRLVVAGLINPSIQSIEQLPYGTRLTREDDLAGNRVYRVELPGGAIGEATFSQTTLTEISPS